MTYSQQAATIEYRGVERMVKMLTGRVAARYGMQPEDLESVANLAYAKAYDSFNPNVGRFSSWVWLKVSRGLTDFANRVKPTLSLDDETSDGRPYADFLASPAEFDREGFVDGLSSAARTVVGLLLDVPGDLKTIMNYNATPGKQRSILRGWLKKLGWTFREATAAFCEIKDAIISPPRRSGWDRFFDGVFSELRIGRPE